MGKIAVPKTGQKPPLPRRDASGPPVGGVAVPKTVQKNALARDNLNPMGPPASRALGSTASLSLPLSVAIDLHEIHLARQSSLQIPVGHIPVPGGIKLCSPGTFLVANYLIINNGSCQVNFTKPNRAAIRNTKSQWPRRDCSEMPVGRVAVPKTGKSIGTLPFLDRSAGRSSHGDCSEVPVGKIAAP